jgi:threonylcarbamoyladenosine tRNA methylthiotransferase MtaB
MKTVKFLTLGCKVNQYETQKIREDFLNFGFKEIDNGQKADIYIINTCTVTRHADTESLKLIRRSREENPRARIVVTGCLAELDTDKVKQACRRSLIFKNKDKEKIVFYFAHRNEATRQWFDSVLRQAQNTSPKETEQRRSAHHPQRTIPSEVEGQDNETTKNGITYFKGHTRAFLKIQDGCNNFCAYCKVPLARGTSRSREKGAIIQEAKCLVKNGFKEIVLTGICLGSFGQDLKPKADLVELIKDLEKIEGLFRIRLSSIEARDVSDELITIIAESKKLCRHLHIPIQSGDDEILKKMNRHYTRSYYIDLVKKIKAKIPDVAITTDCLVGFPGETQENFLNTEKLIKEIVPLRTHIFGYSPREGTVAFGFAGNLNPEIIRERINSLKKIAEFCAQKYKRGFLGKNKDVLIECRNKDTSDLWVGYTDNYIKVLIKAPQNLENQIVSTQLKKVIKDYVLGKIYFD